MLNYAVPSANIFVLGVNRIVPHLLLVGDGYTIWTISVEFQFYALFAVIWWAASLKYLMTVLIPIFVVAVGVMYWISTSAGRINLFGYLLIFVLGILISQMTVSGAGIPR